MMFRRASELAEDPELMRPRAVMVPPCVVAGMITLVAMLAKGGKSTTLAGVIRDASLQGIACALLSLDEALTDSVQRLERLGADLDLVFIATEWEPGELEAELVALGVKVLGIDHLGKLAERDPDFGANSQGDPLLWGRLISPIADLARRNDIGVILLDQARRSDGGYTGSNAKAATVDILCELREKDGGLVCTPKSRIPLPGFRVDLDANGAPVFSPLGDRDTATRPPSEQGVGETVLADVFRLLMDAEPEGLRSNQWKKAANEALRLSPVHFHRARRAHLVAGRVTMLGKIYRTTRTGESWLAQVRSVPTVPVGINGTNGTSPVGTISTTTLKGCGTGTNGLPSALTPEWGDAWEPEGMPL